MSLPDFISELQVKLDYEFSSAEFIRTALTMTAGAGQDSGSMGSLMRTGDAMLQAVICDDAYTRKIHPKHSQSHLKNIELHEYRAKLASTLDLPKGIRLYAQQTVSLSTKVLSRAFGAIIGAVWRDSSQNWIKLAKVIGTLGLLVVDRRNQELEQLTAVQSHDQDHFIPQGTGHETQFGQDLFNDPAIPSTLIDTDYLGQGFTDMFEQAGGQGVLETSNPTQNNVSEGLPQESMAPTLLAIDAGGQVSPGVVVPLQMDHTFHDMFTRPGSTDVSFRSANSEGTTDDSTRQKRSSVEDNSPGTIRQSHKRRRKMSSRSLQIDHLIQHYTETDQNRFIKHGIYWAPFEISFDKISTRSDSAGYSSCAKALFYTLASPEAVVNLMSMLTAHRSGKFSSETKHDLSKRERIMLIERLEDHAAIITMVRRYHILKLYLDCSGIQSTTQAGFIHSTTLSLKSSVPGPGNPLHKSTSNVTGSMMKDLYPDIQENSPQHDAKSKFVTNLRRLGLKLQYMLSKFNGWGFLGLMSRPSLDGLDDPFAADKILTNLPDGAFRYAVDQIDSRIGEIIRETGKLVEDVVHDLCQGSVREEPEYPLERLVREEVLHAPRSKDHLLAMLQEKLHIG